MKLRCASVKEAEDWKEALEAESAVIVDSSPAPEESSATEVLNYSLLIQCQNDYQLDKIQAFLGPTGFSVFSFYNSSSVFFFFYNCSTHIDFVLCICKGIKVAKKQS